MSESDITNYLRFDPQKPEATAREYDRLINAAIASAEEFQLRSVYARLDCVRAVTGGFARAASNVAYLPPGHPDCVHPNKRRELLDAAERFRAIEQIAKDKASRVLEFLGDDD